MLHVIFDFLCQGCIAPIAVRTLRQIGDDDNSLLEISDVVRYIFSFIPSFSFAYSISALVDIQTVNNVCINNVDIDSLKDICKLAKDRNAAEFLNNPSYFSYIPCCDEKYVPKELAICSDVPDVLKPFITSSTCHEVTSLYTFDKLNGINEGLLWLTSTCLLYMGILVLLESGAIQFLISSVINSSIKRVIVNGPFKISKNPCFAWHFLDFDCDPKFVILIFNSLSFRKQMRIKTTMKMF